MKRTVQHRLRFVVPCLVGLLICMGNLQVHAVGGGPTANVNINLSVESFVQIIPTGYAENGEPTIILNPPVLSRGLSLPTAELFYMR